MFYTEFEIESNLNKLIEVEQFIENLMLDFSINNDYFGIVSTPLLEAVKNAIIHGNQSDVLKKVSITCQISNKNLTFTVSDQGNGFDYANILSINPDERTSNGLAIIELLTDKLEFLNNGQTLSYTINVPVQIRQGRHLNSSSSEIKEKQYQSMV